MKTIILDTDFILQSIKWKITLVESLKKLCDFNFNIAYLDKTIDELKKKPNQALAIQILSSFNQIKTLKNKSVDELILDLTNKDKTLIIATLDKELKEKLKKGKIVIITIRQKKYLIFV